MAKPSLLLVDADLRSLRVLEVSLKKAGFMVTTAVSGADALAKVDLAHPELVISDTHMPEMDGFELCRRLKGSTAWADVPFIFLTSHSAVEDKIRGLELGVEDYLTKPIYLKEILTRVRILLQKREQKALQEKRDAKTKFSGQLSDMAVVDLIQTVEISRKSGVIHFSQAEQRAAIFFRNGKVIDAEHGRLAGADAVYRLLLWGDGQFEVEFKSVRRKESIPLSSQALLMEGMRRVDEWGRLLEQLPPLETVLEVVPQELSARIGELPDSANGLLRLIDGRRTIMQLVDDWGVGDLAALEVIARMYFQGLLAPMERTSLAPMDEAKEKALVGWLESATTGATTRPTRHSRPQDVILPPRDVPVPTIDAPFGEAPAAPESAPAESTIKAGGAAPPGVRRAPETGPVTPIDPLSAIMAASPAATDTSVDSAQIEAEAPAALGLPRTPSQEMAAIPLRPSQELAAVVPPRRASQEVAAVLAPRRASQEIPTIPPPLLPEEQITPVPRKRISEEITAVPEPPSSKEALSDRSAIQAMLEPSNSGAPQAELDADETPRVGPPAALRDAALSGIGDATPVPVEDPPVPRALSTQPVEEDMVLEHDDVPTAAPDEPTRRLEGDDDLTPIPSDGPPGETIRVTPPPVAMGALARVRLGKRLTPPPIIENSVPLKDARSSGAVRSMALPEPHPDYSSDPTPLPPPPEMEDDHPRSISSEGADRREVSGMVSVNSQARPVSSPHPASVVTVLPTSPPSDPVGVPTRLVRKDRPLTPPPVPEPANNRWIVWGGLAAVVAAGVFLVTSSSSSKEPKQGVVMTAVDAAPAPSPADAAPEPTIPDAAPPSGADAAPVRAVEIKPPGPGPEQPPPVAEPDPDDPKAMLKQARRYKGSGKSEEAIALCDKVLARDPGSVDARLLKAEIMIDRGQRSAALQLIDKVLADRPRSGDAWMLKGLIHYDQGESQKARAAFEKYLEIRPNGKRADDVRVMLESL